MYPAMAVVTWHGALVPVGGVRDVTVENFVVVIDVPIPTTIVSVSVILISKNPKLSTFKSKTIDGN